MCLILRPKIGLMYLCGPTWLCGQDSKLMKLINMRLLFSGGSSSTTRRPPIQINIPILPPNNNQNNHNNSLLFPAVQPTIIPFNEDVMAITAKDAGQSYTNHAYSHSSTTSPSPSPFIPSTVAANSKQSNQITTQNNSRNEYLELPPAISPIPVMPDLDFPERKSSNVEDIVDRVIESRTQPPPLPPPLPPAPPITYFEEPKTSLKLPHEYLEVTKEEFCPPDFVRSLYFNWTRKGDSAIQKCPGGATGLVRWHCSAQLVKWYPEKPDFRECRSLWLDNLDERLNDGNSVIGVATELALMTLTKVLFSEDLSRIAGVIHEALARTVINMEGFLEVWHRQQILKELLMSIVEAVSNLLDNAQDDAWLDLSINQRRHVASKLLDGLQQSALLLAENSNQDGYFSVAKPNVCKY